MLRAIGDATNRLGLPPPAALTGEWFGALAVIAPSLSVQPVDAADAFERASPACRQRVRDGRRRLDRLPVLPRSRRRRAAAPDPEAAGGWTDCVLRCDRDRQWWYESLSGAPDAGLADQRAGRPRCTGDRHATCRIDWDAADREAHRAGVLACLEAIRRRRGLPGVRVHPVHRHDRRGSAGLLHRRRRAHLAGPGGLRRRTVGRGRVAVAGAVPVSPWRSRDRRARSRARCRWTLSPSALRASSKDVAENIMIVDLVRNDLGRVAVTGSVTVPELLVVRPAPGVWHLVSTVSAQVPVELPTLGAAGRHLPAGLGHRDAQTSCATTDFAVGALIGAESIAAQSVWRHRSPAAS